MAHFRYCSFPHFLQTVGQTDMKIASTDTYECQTPKKEDKESEQSRNFRIAALQGTVMRISFAFIDSSTILNTFIFRLTGSNTFVGLVGSSEPAGWMWPQLLISNLLEHRPRKMPFYTLGMSIRVAAWLAIVLCTLLIGSRNNMLLAVSFLCLYFIGSSAMGVSTIPYMDIVSKSIEPQRRARFFSMRQFSGGLFSFFIGFFISFILSDKSGLTFPNNYALLFGLTVLSVAASFVIFLAIREPIHPVQAVRKSLWQHLKQGPYFLRTDRNYRRFLFFRVFTNLAGMCMPFYALYAQLRFGIPDSRLGWFISVSALSGVISNAWWGYIGEKHGVRRILISTSALACAAPFVALAVRPLPPSWQLPCYFLVFVINGASMNGMMVGFMTYMLNLAPSLSRPTYLGFINTVLFPLSFVPVLGGAFVSVIDYEGVFAIAMGMGILALFMATRLEDVIHIEDEIQ
jgi:MFS family permease